MIDKIFDDRREDSDDDRDMNEQEEEGDEREDGQDGMNGYGYARLSQDGNYSDVENPSHEATINSNGNYCLPETQQFQNPNDGGLPSSQGSEQVHSSSTVLFAEGNGQLGGHVNENGQQAKVKSQQMWVNGQHPSVNGHQLPVNNEHLSSRQNNSKETQNENSNLGFNEAIATDGIENLSLGTGMDRDVNSVDSDEEEERERERLEMERAAREALEADVKQRNFPISEEQRSRVLSAMKGISVRNFAPTWAGNLSEEKWVKLLKERTEKRSGAVPK